MRLEYEPDFFFQEEGVNYATYGPFAMSVDVNGRLTVDVNDLKSPYGDKKEVPQGYYTVYCFSEMGFPDEDPFSETGVFYLSATAGSPSGSDSGDSGGSGDSGDSGSSGYSGSSGNSGGGGGGGCNAGILGAVTLILAVIPRKER